MAAESTNFTALAQFTVPRGMFAVIRSWAAQPDLDGWFVDTAAALPVVRFRLLLGQQLTINGPGMLGNVGSLDDPMKVSYVVPEGQLIAIQAFSADAVMWHLVETRFEGYLVETTDFSGDSIKALLHDGQ